MPPYGCDHVAQMKHKVSARSIIDSSAACKSVTWHIYFEANRLQKHHWALGPGPSGCSIFLVIRSYLEAKSTICMRDSALASCRGVSGELLPHKLYSYRGHKFCKEAFRNVVSRVRHCRLRICKSASIPGHRRRRCVIYIYIYIYIYMCCSFVFVLI